MSNKYFELSDLNIGDRNSILPNEVFSLNEFTFTRDTFNLTNNGFNTSYLLNPTPFNNSFQFFEPSFLCESLPFNYLNENNYINIEDKAKENIEENILDDNSISGKIKVANANNDRIKLREVKKGVIKEELKEEKKTNKKVKFMVLKGIKNQVENVQNLLNRKRGRKKKLFSKNNIKKNHNKNTKDNKLKKIKSHYENCIISFNNEILKKFNYHEKYLKINKKFKLSIKNNLFEQIKNKNIGNILSEKISSKFKKYGEDHNKKLFEKFNQNIILNKIYSENYIHFFKNVYFKNNREINLTEYGIKDIIYLSKKVKLFQDLLDKFNEDKDYKEDLKKCAIKNFSEQKIFKLD